MIDVSFQGLDVHQVRGWSGIVPKSLTHLQSLLVHLASGGRLPEDDL